MKLTRFSVLLPGLLAVVLMASCASNAPKGNIADTANPQEEFSRLTTALDDARSRDVDVLAAKEFKKSDKAHEDAKDKMSDGKKQEKILDDLRISQGFLNEANALAEKRRASVPALFEARHAAIAAGGFKHPQLRKDFDAVDENIIDKSEDLGALTAEKQSAMIQSYVGLERRAAVLTALGPAMSKIAGAKKDDADKKAPNTLKTAEVDVKNAESIISTNVRNPSAYQEAVAKSNQSSTLLIDVMTTINQNGKKIPESTALKLVEQNKKISGLQSDVARVGESAADYQARLGQKNSELDKKNSELNAKNSQLSDAEQKVAIQRAMEKARSDFDSKEVEAYQQGNKLVFRLKNMNFPSGRAELPTESLAVLAKVAEVAKSLNAGDIKVEGHTDAVGAKALNDQLSSSRAEAVASYFKTNGFDKVESEGYGFSKPVASNKTKEGRAQNRRVDVVIEPAAPTTQQ